MHVLPESWNELIDWLYSTPKAAMSEHMQAARQVTLFHCSVINGGIHNQLEDHPRYPHAELILSFQLVYGEGAADIIREGVNLTRRPDPTANLSKDADRALIIAVDSVSRRADLKRTLKDIAAVWPEISVTAGTLAYNAAVAQVIHYEPYIELNRRYFESCDDMEVIVSRYADAFAAEWRSQSS